MIQREELNQILSFVASRWDAAVKEPDNKAMEGLPNDFWMNSIGGKTAKGGFWVTTIMYTENEAEAEQRRLTKEKEDLAKYRLDAKRRGRLGTILTSSEGLEEEDVIKKTLLGG